MNKRLRFFLGAMIFFLGLFPFYFGSVPVVRAQGDSWFVSPTGLGTDCFQANPCLPEDAMDKAIDGDTIYFKFGSYTDVLSDPYLTIDKPVSLIGGWDGSPTGDVVVDSYMYGVVIDGGYARALFKVNDTSGTGGLIAISGFTFQEGSATDKGGAIYVQNGRVDIIDNIFLENSADNYGGAIAIDSNYDIQILNNWFEDNVTDNGGGSIFAGSSDATVLIEGNSFTGGAANYGTAIHNDSCRLSINRNTFQDVLGSSAIMLYSSGLSSTVSNNFFIQPAGDALITWGDASYQVINNTFVGGRYAINVYGDSPTSIMNNIITGASESIHSSDSSPTGSNNLFWGNTSNPNLLTDPVQDDPEFVNPAADDYHISEDSPAVDTGATVALSADYDGDERPIGEGFDIGADEVKSGYLVFLPLVLK